MTVSAMTSPPSAAPPLARRRAMTGPGQSENVKCRCRSAELGPCEVFSGVILAHWSSSMFQWHSFVVRQGLRRSDYSEEETISEEDSQILLLNLLVFVEIATRTRGVENCTQRRLLGRAAPRNSIAPRHGRRQFFGWLEGAVTILRRPSWHFGRTAIPVGVLAARVLQRRCAKGDGRREANIFCALHPQP